LAVTSALTEMGTMVSMAWEGGGRTILLPTEWSEETKQRYLKELFEFYE